MNHPRGTAFNSRIEDPGRIFGGKTETAQVRRITMLNVMLCAEEREKLGGSETIRCLSGMRRWTSLATPYRSLLSMAARAQRRPRQSPGIF